MAESIELVEAGQLDTFIDQLWLEDGLAKNTLDSYRTDLSQFDVWLHKNKSRLLTANQADIHNISL